MTTFDRWQFYKGDLKDNDRAIRGFRTEGIGVDSLSRIRGLEPDDLRSCHMVKFSRPHRDVSWAADGEKVLRLLTRVFPHVFRPGKRPIHERGGFYSAARWHEVIRLYFAYGWDRKSVAEQLSITPIAVKAIVQRIRLARHGASEHGKRVRQSIA